MKFGKSIRAEARNNRGLSFVNFKQLKKLLKRCGAAVFTKAWDQAKEEDQCFLGMLDAELRKVGESYWKELQQIFILQKLIQQKLPYLDIQPKPETYTRMGFDQLQAHLQSLGGLGEIPSSAEERAAGASSSDLSAVKTSAALCEFCLNLGKISARCKRLRRCVLWNAVAVVKILKKRQKLIAALSEGVVWQQLQAKHAAEVLAQQDWYRCSQLPRIVSIVETTTDELMQRLTLSPPNRDRYQCPICLDVVVDPVCLRTCGHRFCWACLCMAFCEKPEGTLERCPCCRAAFPLDPEAFEVDGILSRFLRTFFPEDQSIRLLEQRQSLRERLERVQRNEHKEEESKEELGEETEWGQQEEKRGDFRRHCCPDCVEETTAIVVGRAPPRTVKTTPKPIRRVNTPLFRTAAKWLRDGSSHSSSDERSNDQHRYCRHVSFVKGGKPADVEHLAFTSRSSPMDACSTKGNPMANMCGAIAAVSTEPSPLGDTPNPSKGGRIAEVLLADDKSLVNSIVTSLLMETPLCSSVEAPPLLGIWCPLELPPLGPCLPPLRESNVQRADTSATSCCSITFPVEPEASAVATEFRLPDLKVDGFFGGGLAPSHCTAVLMNNIDDESHDVGARINCWMCDDDAGYSYEAVDEEDDAIEEALSAAAAAAAEQQVSLVSCHGAS